MDQVWIVWGSCGMYDDFSEWVVEVYSDQAAADAHAAAATAWLREHLTELLEMTWAERDKLQSPYDSGFLYDFDTVKYTVGGPYPVMKSFSEK